MWVMKFGGSSLADARHIENCAALIAKRAQAGPTVAVLSAMKGVTNAIAAGIEDAVAGRSSAAVSDALAEKHLTVINQWQARFNLTAAPLVDTLERHLAGLRRDLEGVRLLRQCPPKVEARLLGVGERLSVRLMTALLEAQGLSALAIDPIESLVARGGYLDAEADIEATGKKLAELPLGESGRIGVAPGFIAGNEAGEQVTFGRNGSDYSAAVIAAALGAEACEIWTDVDGVYSANPADIPKARLIRRLSCREAMELSYFGAKVLHPKTIQPIARGRIACWIKNSRNPEAPGTLISDREPPSRRVKGVSRLDDAALVNIAGPGLKGVVGLSARLFGAIARAGVSVALMTQSSSEYCITICIPARDADRAVRLLGQEFQYELLHGRIEPIEAAPGRAVVSLVGDGMRSQKGVAARFFTALAHGDVNVEAIAQGSSESSISAVVRQEQAAAACAAIHRAFFETADIWPIEPAAAPPAADDVPSAGVAKAYAPATIGNFSVGFDALGAAVAPLDGDLLGDVVEAAFDDSVRGFKLDVTGPFADLLPPNPEDNILLGCLRAFDKALAQKRIQTKPVALRLEKNLPVCSGLGSSACSIVAGLRALNGLYGAPLDDEALLALMGGQEAKISGSLHYDNVGPAFLGGLQLMAAAGSRQCVRLPFFEDWLIIVAFPGLAVSTKEAREVLPEHYPRNVAIAHGARLATFVHALYRRDASLAAAAIGDLIAEPYRKHLLPRYDEAEAYLRRHGALAAGISGSGSSLFAIVDDEAAGRELTEWLAEHYKVNERAFARLCRLDRTGARLL